MAYELTWSPTARLDLRNLVAYIAEENPIAARQFAQGVFQAIEHLRQFPQSGRAVPEFDDPTIREVFRWPCRIVYRVQAAQSRVEIARIWHAARGTPAL